MPSLKLENVAKHFGGLKAVDKVSMEVPPGDAVTTGGTSGVPQVLVHRCEAVLDARYVCAHCGLTVRAWDVALPSRET